MQGPSNLSGQQDFVWRYRLPFSNWAWIHDGESLNDFPSLPALNNPSNPPIPRFSHVSTLMTKVLIHFYLSLLLSSQYSHPPPLGGHSRPPTQVPLSPHCKLPLLSPYLFPIHFLSCQLTGLRALVDGIKENAIEVNQSCPNLVEHLQATGSWYVLRGVAGALTILSPTSCSVHSASNPLALTLDPFTC